MSEHITDPIEQIIAEALRGALVRYIHESEGETLGLDFYLPDCDIHVEVKQYHSERIADQMARVSNIIVIQGRTAALAFAKLINRGNEESS